MELNVDFKFEVPIEQRHESYRRRSTVRSNVAQSPASLQQVLTPYSRNAISGDLEQDFGSADQGGTGG